MLVVATFQPAARMGSDMFAGLVGTSMVYAILAGPLTTVDALSRERREGTLGLLFLTRLRGYDVVLGKTAAASLDLLLGVAALLPIVAIPMLLGGVTLSSIGVASCGIFNLAFFSLATGIFASAFCKSGRVALGITVGVLAALTLLVPWVCQELFHIGPGSRLAPYVFVVCPLYSMELTLELAMGSPRAAWKFGLNMAGLHVLGWSFIAVASLYASRSWRGLPEAPWLRWWSRAGQSLSRRSRKGALRWRAQNLGRNPARWLEGRSVLQNRLIRIIAFSAVGWWLAGHLLHPRSWPDADMVILWPFFGHYIFCFWLAIDAPRRLADDKHSGALELLLCTPLSPESIVSGNFRALLRRFGPAFLVLVALYTYQLLFYQHFNRRDPELFLMGVMGGVVIFVQAFAFLRVGLYQGLVSANSLRATFMLIWKLGLLPWALFLVSILFVEIYRQAMGFSFREFEVFLCIWGATHLLVCIGFGALAEVRLRKSFRALARTRYERSIWSRFFDSDG